MSMQSLSFEHDVPTFPYQCLAVGKPQNEMLSMPWQCQFQVRVGLGTCVVVFIVVKGDEVGGLLLPEHNKETLPVG